MGRCEGGKRIQRHKVSRVVTMMELEMGGSFGEVEGRLECNVKNCSPMGEAVAEIDL
jgi:hypothetical protein